MVYKLLYSERAIKQLDKMDKPSAAMIVKWMNNKIDCCDNPRAYGKSLKGELSRYWRYRVGNYRIICVISDNDLTVLAVMLGNRKNVYK